MKRSWGFQSWEKGMIYPPYGLSIAHFLVPKRQGAVLRFWQSGSFAFDAIVKNTVL